MSIPTPNDNFNRKRKILASAMDRRPNSTLDGGFLKRRPAETPYTRTAKSKLSNGGSVRATPVDQLILHAGLRAEFKKMSLGTFIDVIQSISKYFLFVSRDNPELLVDMQQGLKTPSRDSLRREQMDECEDTLIVSDTESEPEEEDDDSDEHSNGASGYSQPNLDPF